MPARKSIRAVAAFEAFKGLLALLAASGVLLLLHGDLHGLVVRLAAHTHLNPAAHAPGIFVAAAQHLENTRFTLLALGAGAYATLRFVEAYGLYREAAWAEVLAAASGAIYIPFEVAGLLRHAGWLGLGALVINVAVVAIMLSALWRRRTPVHAPASRGTDK